MSTSTTLQEITNIHALSTNERADLMRSKYTGKSRFQRMFSADAIDLDCAAYAQNLRAEVIRLLAIKGVEVPGGKLETLHETISPELKEYNFNDGVNKLSALLYDSDDRFVQAYHAMLRDCIQKHFPFPFYFQATATIRIHCPDAKNSDHYPRYHTDIGYGHPPEEINLWLPLTEPQPQQYHGFRRTDIRHSYDILESFGFDFAPFIERAVTDKKFNSDIDHYTPQVKTAFGKIHTFDSRCIHTGEPLLNHTRASIDIRLISVEDFEKLEVEYQGSGRRRMRYIPGQAYHSTSSDKL